MSDRPAWRRPNIILIQTDQHRYDGVRVNGNTALSTPGIDRLGAEGVVMDRAYVQSPLCMPSRASLITGQYPRGHGVWTNGVPLPADVATLPGMLADAGYRTASVGKVHLTPYNMEPIPGGGKAEEVFPESFAHWPVGRARLTEPYFGIESVALTLGHNYPGGHYGDWLAAEHPDAVDLFGPESALESPSGAMQSWRSALPVECHSSTWIGDTTVQRLQEFAAVDEPFFVWASFPDPHHPFAPPEPYASQYRPSDVPEPARRDGEFDDKPPHFRRFAAGGVMHDGAYPDDRPAEVSAAHLREIIAHTYGMISLVDYQVEKILDSLDELGLAHNTIVIFTSDHGELLGDHGLMLKGPFMYESLIHVPLIIRYPDRLTPGRRGALVGHVDLLATLAELAQVEPGPTVGESFASVLVNGDGAAHRDVLFSEYGSGYWPELNLKTVISPRWKLTVYPTPGIGELYDLEGDPYEFVNRFDDPSCTDVRRDLTDRLLGELIMTEPRTARKYAHA